jgi:hypothetical protein
LGTSATSARCSSGVQSKNVGTTRCVTTSTWPGDTGNESKIAKQRSLAQTHSASGTSRNGEGAAGSMAGSVRPADNLGPGYDHFGRPGER